MRLIESQFSALLVVLFILQLGNCKPTQDRARGSNESGNSGVRLSYSGASSANGKKSARRSSYPGASSLSEYNSDKELSNRLGGSYVYAKRSDVVPVYNLNASYVNAKRPGGGLGHRGGASSLSEFNSGVSN